MTPPADNPATALLPRPAGAHGPIETLIARHDGDVRAALRQVLGRSQEEDDLVQEVFTRLVVRLRQPGELCVGAWLRGVAHNLAVDEIRRRRPVPVDDVRLDRQVPSAADDVIAGTDLYSRVVRGARELPDRQRAALSAALSNGGPGVAGVASTLGVSVHAAESLLSRARVGLRHQLASTGGDAGSARLSLGVVVAAVAAVVASVARRWRLA
ncbi:MAG: RNA polymerase sigma factor, partial [Acidimicrobiales bacterium]